MMLGVVPVWDKVFLLLFFLGGEAVWGSMGVMGCLWQVSPKPLGQACWRCHLLAGCFPWRIAIVDCIVTCINQIKE